MRAYSAPSVPDSLQPLSLDPICQQYSMKRRFSSSSDSFSDKAYTRSGPQNRIAGIVAGLLLAGTVLSPLPALSAERMDRGKEASSLQAVTLRIDNDLFAGSDRGYSNGISIDFLSQAVDDFRDPRLPDSYRWLNRGLEWLQPRNWGQYNMALTVGHGIFTPGKWRARGLVEDDRPYAGALILGVNYNGRNDSRMQTTGLDLGIVGPSALGEQIQKGIHKLAGSETFRGWDNQLHDEVVFRLSTQYLRRLHFEPTGDDWQSDLILRLGGGFGNLLTDFNIGTEWRFGPELPDNFGSSPLLPASENTAPTRHRSYDHRLKLHGFVVTNLRAIAHDITLDGNTWKDSHSVTREPVVADLGIGVAGIYGHWRFAFAHYLRSREFEQQDALPKLGSFSIWQEF